MDQAIHHAIKVTVNTLTTRAHSIFPCIQQTLSPHDPLTLKKYKKYHQIHIDTEKQRKYATNTYTYLYFLYKF